MILQIYKSAEISDKTRNMDLNIFFQAHLRDQIFLIVCGIYIREICGQTANRIPFLDQLIILLRKWKKVLLFKHRSFSPGVSYT